MTDKSQTVQTSFLKKRWVKVVLSIAFLIIISLILLPIGAKLYITDWLEKNGADTAQIETMSFNPFTTRLTVKGVDVIKDGHSLIKNSSMVIDMGLPALFNRDVRVEKAEYIDLSIDLQQFKDGSWQIGSVVTPVSSDEKPTQPDDGKSPEWNVLADHMLLTNCTVSFKTPELNFNILIKNGELKKITTHKNEAYAHLLLEGELNNKPFRIELEDLQIRPAVKFKGNISVGGFELSDLGVLLAEPLPVFSGNVGIDGTVLFVMGDADGISVDYDGTISLVKGHIGQAGFDTSVDDLGWKGSVQYSDKKSEPMVIKTDGQLSGSNYNLQLPGTNFTTSESSIDYVGKTEVYIDDHVSVMHDGSLLVEDVLVELPEQKIHEKQLKWQGRSQYDSSLDEKGLFVKTDGTLVLGLVQYESEAFSGQVEADGKVLFAMAEADGMSVDYDGTIRLAKGHVGQASFETSVDVLSWDGSVLYSDKKSESMVIKTDGQLSGSNYNLQLPGTNFTTSESSIDYVGKTEVYIDDHVSVMHDGSLLVEDALVELPEQKIHEKHLKWQGRSQYDSSADENGLLVKTDGALELGPVQYESGADSGQIEAGVSELSWEGAVRVGESNNKSSLVEIDGTLIGTQIMASLQEPKMQIFQESLNLKTNTRAGFGAKLEIEGQTALDLNKFTLSNEQETKPILSIDALNVIDLTANENNQLRVKEVSSKMITSHLAGEMPLDIDVDQIQMKNLFVDNFKQLSSDSLVVDNTSVLSSLDNKELANLEKLEIQNIQVDEQKRVVVDGVELNNIRALKKQAGSENPAISLVNAILTKVTWDSENGIAGDQLKLENLQAALVRDKEGELTVNTQLKAAKKTKTETAETPGKNSDEKAVEESSTGIPIKLKEFIATGENNIVFEDYSLAVPYLTDLVITDLQATDIDSSKPDNQIKILLKGEFEKHAPLELSGTVSPFGGKTALDLDLSLKNYPLTSLSAYTVQSIGTALSGGQLKIKSDITLADDKLDMKNKVDLRKLETKTISPELAAELNNELPIPLDAALSLLRDSKDDISLSVPFSGPLSDLNVGISDVLITALSKAIVPAASGYLMYTLGPYGALAYVGVKVGEKMLEVKFPPVEFAPQMVEITEVHEEYLERIGTILKDKPEMDLQICPRVPVWELLSEEKKKAITSEDMVEPEGKEREQLLALGEQRGLAIQSYLVGKHGIEINRLLICDTVIELEMKSLPKVLLQI